MILWILFLDLIPEIIELSNIISISTFSKFFLIFFFLFVGIFALKFFDIFIPYHDHYHKDNEKNHQAHVGHSFHIGFAMSFSLILHNLIEGISIYIMTLGNFTGGFLLSLAVGLHNFPLSIEIASSLEADENHKMLKVILQFLLIISSFLGAFLLALFKIQIHDIILLILMSISLGMILYISLFELFKEIYNYKDKKDILYGFLLGVIILFLLSFLE